MRRGRQPIAQIQVVEAVLAAAQSQDHAVLRRKLYELGVIVSAGARAVAARNQDEMADIAGLDCLDDGPGARS